MANDLITMEEVCQILDFWSKNTIATYTSSGKIPSVRIGLKKIRYRRSVIEAFKKSLFSERGGSYGKN